MIGLQTRGNEVALGSGKQEQPTPVSVEQLNRFFESPPRRQVNGRSRPTQRFVFRSDCSGVTVTEGGNELTAALLFEHMWRCGWLRRYKFQPFSLDQLDLPETTVPDVLVELVDGRYFLVEVKSAKFLTPEKRQKFEATASLLRTRSLNCVLWTDANELSKTVWHNARHLQRASRLKVDDGDMNAVLPALPHARTLGQLMQITDTPFDVLLAVAARGVFHLNLQKKFDEHAHVFTKAPTHEFNMLFSAGPNAGGWWNRVPSHCVS